MAEKITPSLEDYLETIYDLSVKGQSARVTDVAASLNIAKSSVHLAMHALKDKGLVEQEHYGQITLTESGLETAKIVRHKHNALLAFLTGVLGVEPATAEKEACAIEHSISVDTVEKLEKLTKNLISGAAEAISK